MSVGYIYVMTNAAMPGLVKIGLTRHDVSRRAKELASTGVPTPFVVEYYCLTSDCEEVERLVHSHFDGVRAPGREFFRVEPSQAVMVIDSLVRPVKPERFCTFTFVNQTARAQTEGSLKLPPSVSNQRGKRFFRDVVRCFQASGESSATLWVNGVSGQELFAGLEWACKRERAKDVSLRCMMGDYVGLYKRPTSSAKGAADARASKAPPGWYVDPTGRHEHRYWDGAVWSDAVSDQGIRSSDSL